ncbi:hypothetical protein SCOR_33105 [Sulfidibacter corallicola]
MLSSFPTKSLTFADLIDQIQQLNQGMLINLEIRDGQPYIGESTRWIRRYPCHSNSSKPAKTSPSAANALADLCNLIISSKVSVIDKIEIQRGLPTHVHYRTFV